MTDGGGGGRGSRRMFTTDSMADTSSAKFVAKAPWKVGQEGEREREKVGGEKGNPATNTRRFACIVSR